MKIESRDRSIGDLLTSGYYVIPRFQRPYSWDSENIAEFWDDVIVNKSVDYFIGSLRCDGSEEEMELFYIPQRLDQLGKLDALSFISSNE